MPQQLRECFCNIIKEFWLSLFRNWLLKLQDAYDQDKERGLIDDEGWTKEVFYGDILAYKLPVDKSLLRSVRLVSCVGIINPSPGL